MSEEMKLLMALCDALGFEVERNVDFNADAYLAAEQLYEKIESFNKGLFIKTPNLYPNTEDYETTSFKLTKKPQ